MFVNLKYTDCYYKEDENKIYFFSMDVNGIFSIDLNNNEPEFITHISEYDVEAKALYGTVVCVGDELVFAPQNAKDILIYDLLQKNYRLAPLNNDEEYLCSGYKFFSEYVDGESVYMFPANYPAIIQYDLSSDHITYYTKWLDEVKKTIPNGKDYFRQSLCYANGVVIVPFCYSDKVLLFNLQNKEITIKALDTKRNSKQGFSGICYDGENYWLPSLSDELVFCWNTRSEEMISYNLGNDNDSSQYSYVGCNYNAGKVYIRPAFNNEFCYIDVKTKAVKKIGKEEYGFCLNEVKGVSSTILCMKKIVNNNLMMCVKNGKHYMIDNSYTDVKLVNVSIDLDRIIKNWFDFICSQKGVVINESDDFSLNMLLKLI